MPHEVSRQVTIPTTLKQVLEYGTKRGPQTLTSGIRLKLNAELAVGGTVSAYMRCIYAFSYIGIMWVNGNMMLEFVEIGFRDDVVLFM